MFSARCVHQGQKIDSETGSKISFEYKGNIKKHLYRLTYFHFVVRLRAVLSHIKCLAFMVHRDLSNKLIKQPCIIDKPVSTFRRFSMFFIYIRRSKVVLNTKVMKEISE
jgi:hypothetical protein